MLILSICIPYYNRIHALKENLAMIFQSSSNEFEVVVVDNSSPTDVRKELRDIRDSRLRIIRREEPVSPGENGVSSIIAAKGKYAFLCLDKNYIIGYEIDQFIDCLKKHPKLCGGYCRFRSTEEEAVQKSKRKFKIYGKRAPLKFCYGNHHPTGMFYRTEIIQHAYPGLLQREIENPYICDILAAECAVRGSMMEYDYPIWYSYKGLQEEQVKSYSYSFKAQNIWFTPENRIKSFKEFCSHLNRMPCSVWTKKEIILRLYLRTMKQITFEYREYITSEGICRHYYMECRKDVPKGELRGYVKQFNQEFLKSNIIASKLGRYLIYTAANFLFVLGKGKYLL